MDARKPRGRRSENAGATGKGDFWEHGRCLSTPSSHFTPAGTGAGTTGLLAYLEVPDNGLSFYLSVIYRMFFAGPHPEE